MLEIFNYWQVNLALAILLFVIMHQCYRAVAQKVDKTSHIVITTGIIGSLFFIVLIPFFEVKFPHSWNIYGLLLASSMIYIVHDLMKFKSYKYLDVSVITILFQLSKVFFVLYGILLFGEKLTRQEVFGIVFILGGVSLVAFKKKNFQINKHIYLVLGAALAFATAMTIDVDISSNFSLPFYLLIIYLIPAVFVFIGGKHNINDLKKDFFINKNSPILLVIAGVTSALAMLFYLLALRQGQVSIVAPLSSVTVLLNVIVGYVFLKERDDLVKRIIAAIVTIVGIILLV